MFTACYLRKSVSDTFQLHAPCQQGCSKLRPTSWCAGTLITATVQNRYNTYAFGGSKVSMAARLCMHANEV